MARVESPSSINLFKQCPRKYYYRYIEGKKIPPNVYTVRGNIAHTVMEKFFEFDKPVTKSSCDQALQQHMESLLIQEWQNYGDKLKEISISPEDNRKFFEETLLMLLSWLNKFVHRLRDRPEDDFEGAFKALAPAYQELQFSSRNYKVRGFIDAIHHTDGEVELVDYKTSREAKMTDEYRLQGAIYALLYMEKHGQPPHKIAFDFFRHGRIDLPVEPSLMELARKEVNYIHSQTTTKEIEDYPKNISFLCKWCDFFDLCFQSRESFEQVLEIKKGRTPNGFS